MVKVASSPVVTLDTVQAHLSQNVKGEEAELTDDALRDVSDIARIRKVYKNAAPAQKKAANGVHSSTSNLGHLEVQILGSMALRGAT